METYNDIDNTRKNKTLRGHRRSMSTTSLLPHPPLIFLPLTPDLLNHQHLHHNNHHLHFNNRQYQKSMSWDLSIEPFVDHCGFKKRLAFYNFHRVEGKCKDTIKWSYHWIKDKYRLLGCGVDWNIIFLVPSMIPSYFLSFIYFFRSRTFIMIIHSSLYLG